MKHDKLQSWGRYPQDPQTPHEVSWRDELLAKLLQLESTLAFGNGRSYGDSCLAVSSNVVHTRGLNRFIAADWQNGVITAEAGITLQELLQVAIPRGWFLPITPGTQYVTLGGAIANDVHGKNHHVRGTLGASLLAFNLIRSDKPEILCTPEKNKDLFTATIGGLGLTGIIDFAQIQLMPIQSSEMDVTHVRFNSLEEFYQLSKEFDKTHEYTVAWVDCLAKGEQLGRGIFMAANHAQSGPLKFCERKKITVPFAPPISLFNRLSVNWFNEKYYQRAEKKQQKRQNYDPFFYPLDRILNWNLLYGKKGFQQYQCVIPHENALPAMRDLLNEIATGNRGSFLAVLKQCGDKPSPGLLSFPLPGISLALDFPQAPELENLFIKLDTIVRQAQGRLYPAKDAHMRGEDFRRFYPKWQQVEHLRDPALYSKFWQRVMGDQ